MRPISRRRVPEALRIALQPLAVGRQGTAWQESSRPVTTTALRLLRRHSRLRSRARRIHAPGTWPHGAAHWHTAGAHHRQTKKGVPRVSPTPVTWRTTVVLHILATASMECAHALKPGGSNIHAALQDVRLDVGLERGSVEWHIAVPVPGPSPAREYILWEAPQVELMHAQADTHGALVAQPHVQSRGASVILTVPQIERSFTLSLTIYANVAFLPGTHPAVRAIAHTDPVPCSFM